MIVSLDRRRALAAKAHAYAGNLDAALPYLLARGISREVAEMFTMGCVPPGKEFAGRLSIPYVTPGGVVQIKYRCMKPEHSDHKSVDCPKYLYEAGCGSHLYNAQILISASDTVVVTEGELDAACVQAYVGIPAVGYPGTETWDKQPHYRLCFEAVAEVVVIADGDKQGRHAAKHVAESIGSHARVIDMPDGSDSNEFIVSQGAGAFSERVFQ